MKKSIIDSIKENERVFTFKCTFELSGTMPPGAASCYQFKRSIERFWLRIGGGPQWTLIQWNRFQCRPGGRLYCSFTSQRYSNEQRGKDARWAVNLMEKIIDRLKITNYTLKVWMSQLSTDERSFN